uniref:S8 family serine peptidase n=1 Tax=Kribbia dieselivorans TaxID=331526 RepID=UPI000838081C
MHRRSLRRLIVAVGSVPLLTLGFTAPTFGTTSTPTPDPDAFTATPLSPTSVETGHKAASSRLARTPENLRKRTDSALVNVMIKYDYDPTASYTGGVDDLAATSPRTTGRKLNGRSAAERAYTAHIAQEERAITADVRAAVPGARIGRAYRTVYGGVAARVPANEVKDLVNVPGVVAVQPDTLQKPLTDASSDFINATSVQQALGGPRTAGKGLIYGNIDTGVWPEHPSFADQGNLAAPPGPARACDFGDNPLTEANDPFQCNNKLIGGHAFLDTYLADPARAAAEKYHTARDSEGHGTHTSSTTAGNVLSSAKVFGKERGPVRGIAPGAWVIEYKALGADGGFSSDLAAAVQQAILDGVDVINYSISGGTNPYTDPVELAFLDAYGADVFVAASAGNSGPTVSTVNHLSPWLTTVAASTQTREFASTLTVRGSGGASFTAEGASLTDGVGPLPLVLASAAPYGRELCDAPAAPGTFTGQIVACERGGNGRVEKGFNVKAGGAAGMVLYNPTLADVETDNHWLPAVHLADGRSLLTFLAANPNSTAEFTAGVKKNGQGDVMAAFSSRGPGGVAIKPDITAPGVQILAGHTPTPDSVTGGPPGELFQAIAGTSMSSPEVAGSALLVRAAHPTWTAGQTKSALMTASVTTVLKEDLATPADPFDMGAGRVDVGASSQAVLTLDESVDRFFNLGVSELTGVHLNLPSINATVMPGALTTHRTVTNVSGSLQRVNVSTSTEADSSISVTPQKFSVRPGQSQRLTITLKSTAPIGQQRFGSIVLAPQKAGALHLPVAFIHTQGKVSLAQECTPTSVALNATSTCTVVATNNGFDEQPVSLASSATNNLKFTAASGATLTGPRAATASATLTGAKLGVPSVAPAESPAGYLPLSLFGIAPIAVGDETIVNFNVPAFTYNGQSYTRIGVTSNGYTVVGGGSGTDVNCCDLPAGASPETPNNMLAPFWTDLDGTGAPGISVGILTDGTTNWLIVEH